MIIARQASHDFIMSNGGICLGVKPWELKKNIFEHSATALAENKHMMALFDAYTHKTCVSVDEFVKYSRLKIVKPCKLLCMYYVPIEQLIVIPNKFANSALYPEEFICSTSWASLDSLSSFLDSSNF